MRHFSCQYFRTAQLDKWYCDIKPKIFIQQLVDQTIAYVLFHYHQHLKHVFKTFSELSKLTTRTRCSTAIALLPLPNFPITMLPLRTAREPSIWTQSKSMHIFRKIILSLERDSLNGLLSVFSTIGTTQLTHLRFF